MSSTDRQSSTRSGAGALPVPSDAIENMFDSGEPAGADDAAVITSIENAARAEAAAAALRLAAIAELVERRCSDDDPRER
jgi:hypothetical protein